MNAFQLTLNIAQNAHIILGDEVDSDTLASESARATNPVDVVLTIAGEVVVDDQRDLLNIDTTGPDIGRNQHTRVGLAEILHNAVALPLRHISVHRRHGEVGLAHLIGQPVDLAACVAEDDSLCDGECVVQITQRIKLPLLLLNSNEVLLQAFERQLVTLDENANGVGHEFGGHLQNIIGKGGGDNDDLSRRRQVAIHVVDLLTETAVEELVGLIENEHLDVAGAQIAAADHIGDTAGGSRNDVLAVVELADILANVCASNAGMALHVHVVSETHDNRLDLGRKFTGRREHECCHVLVLFCNIGT
jgi:hypothetical protein